MLKILSMLILLISLICFPIFANDQNYKQNYPGYFIFDDHVDSKFLISVRARLLRFGDSDFTLHGTANIKAWWATGTSESLSMEEINFMPGGFLWWREDLENQHIGKGVNMLFPVSARIGFAHESTGDVAFQTFSLSPSAGWNRLISEGKWRLRDGERYKLALFIRGWHVLTYELDTMPGSIPYLGIGESSIVYTEGGKMLALTNRWSDILAGKHINMQLDLALRLDYLTGLYFYTQVFSGYTESLRTYNRRKASIRVGIMLSGAIY